MPTMLTQDDLLAHIPYQTPPGPQGAAATTQRNLADTVAIPNAQITIISAFGCSLLLTWTFTGSEVDVSLILQTPVGSATLGQAAINASNPCVTLGGSVSSFKAEAKVCFDFGTDDLTITASLCAPFVGCKNASTSIHL